MLKRISNRETFAWMPLTGFDKDLADKGVKVFLDRTENKVDGVCLFAFHPDIINQHDGIEKLRVLPPDNCSYFANPYNEERRRQDWTNQDLKDLCTNLTNNNLECYLSVMGSQLNDKFHKEFISFHPELKCWFKDGDWNLNVLKRFNDGSYYQDFFVSQLTRVMLDYGFTGVHLSDNFCPQPASTFYGDFSSDLIDQFIAKTGYNFPSDFPIKDDSIELVKIRCDYIWKNCRAEWITFISDRWQEFWQSVCNAMHKIGRKVFVLGMYCTDPFETLYIKGIDLRKISNAGVDYLMPNMHANASTLLHGRPWRYYEWANMMSLTDAFCPNSKKLNMLTVKDAAEEWDILHHAPTLLERDIYYLPSFTRQNGNNLKRCIDGFNICLADGIYNDEWKWLNDRFDVAFDQLPSKTLTATVVWSDNAFDNTLDEYIKNRRWTVHKTVYEVNKLGALTNSIVKIEQLCNECGDIFVPNFDLLTKVEQQQILNYKGGMVTATACAKNVDRNLINPDLYFEDENSPLNLCAFTLNSKPFNKESILSELAEVDDSPILDVENIPEIISTLNQFMPYQKVSKGFIKSLAKLVNLAHADILESTHPVIPVKMGDGRIRVYAFNDDLLHYAKTVITFNGKIDKVKNISKFPLLPVKFSDQKQFTYTTQDYPDGQKTFRLLIPQGGVSIVDIYYK